MKKVLLLLIILFFIGCSKEETVIDSNNTFKKIENNIVNGQITSQTGGPIYNHTVFIVFDNNEIKTCQTDLFGFYKDSLMEDWQICHIYIYDFDNNKIEKIIHPFFTLYGNNDEIIQNFNIFNPDANTELQSSFTYSGNENFFKFEDESIGNIKKWLWEFGDSTYSDIQDPEHIYQTEGKFYVKLIIENEEELTNTMIQRIDVELTHKHIID